MPKTKTTCTQCGHKTSHPYAMPLGPLKCGAVVHEDKTKPVCRECQKMLISALLVTTTLQDPEHGHGLASLCANALRAVFNGVSIDPAKVHPLSGADFEPDIQGVNPESKSTLAYPPAPLANLPHKKCVACGKMFPIANWDHWCIDHFVVTRKGTP